MNPHYNPKINWVACTKWQKVTEQEYHARRRAPNRPDLLLREFCRFGQDEFYIRYLVPRFEGKTDYA